MNLDVTAHDASERPHQVVHLPGVRTSDGISNTDTIHANFVYSLVDAEEVDEVGSEGILRRKANFDAPGLDKVDYFDGGLGDISHILSMRKFPQERGGANDDVYSVHACGHPRASIQQ